MSPFLMSVLMACGTFAPPMTASELLLKWSAGEGGIFCPAPSPPDEEWKAFHEGVAARGFQTAKFHGADGKACVAVVCPGSSGAAQLSGEESFNSLYTRSQQGNLYCYRSNVKNRAH